MFEYEVRECCGVGINEFHKGDCKNRRYESAPIPQPRECCDVMDDENHKPDCIIMQKLNASYERDTDRWIEGYITQSTENVRKRVVAANNGFHA